MKNLRVGVVDNQIWIGELKYLNKPEQSNNKYQQVEL
jgi:hypothetical protein